MREGNNHSSNLAGMARCEEEDPRELMRPFSSEAMRMDQSRRVNKPENDVPSILDEIEPGTELPNNGEWRQARRSRASGLDSEALEAGMPVTVSIHPLRDGTNGGQFVEITLPAGTRMDRNVARVQQAHVGTSLPLMDSNHDLRIQSAISCR